MKDTEHHQVRALESTTACLSVGRKSKQLLTSVTSREPVPLWKMWLHDGLARESSSGVGILRALCQTSGLPWVQHMCDSGVVLGSRLLRRGTPEKPQALAENPRVLLSLFLLVSVDMNSRNR